MYDEATWVAPGRGPHRTGRTAAIVIGTLLLACCAGGAASVIVGGMLATSGTTDQAGAAEAPVSLARGVPGDGDAQTQPGLNQPVRDGQFEFTVTAVSCGHEAVGEQWWRHEAQGEFCIVELTVRNIGTDARRFADGSQKAKGAEGNTHAADTGAGVVVNGNGDAVWNVINPGNAISAKIVYDVPPGTALTSLELHDSPFSGGVTVALA